MSLDTTAIDAAINEANAQKELQGEEGATAPATTSRKRLSPEERAERDQAKAQEKEEKRLAREAKAAERKLQAEANKKPAHLIRVQKANEKIPELTVEAKDMLVQLLGMGLSLADLEAFSGHVAGHVRLERTKIALDSTVEVGQTVRIVGGDAKFVNMVGTIDRAQRIRCYVNVPGVDKPVYLYTSDVQTEEAVAVDEPLMTDEETPEAEDVQSA